MENEQLRLENTPDDYLRWFYSLPPEEREAIKYIFGNRE